VPDVRELIPGFEPEGELEEAVVGEPALLRGLAWGKPRRAHPEGRIGNHVADLIRGIERAGETGKRRAMLRFVALIHDSFKRDVIRWLPRTGENHHATRARRFAERFTDDERLLATIELHDRPYAIWRRMKRRGRLDQDRLDDVLARVPDHDLLMRFVEIDGASEAKDPEPIRWLREEMRRRGLAGAVATGARRQ
jgi:hypothetical protein